MADKTEERLRSFLKPLEEKEFRYISDLVYYYCGINLHEGKKELVRARLCRRLRELNMESFPQYCDYLQQHADAHEMNILIDILSTNLTSFFREKKHFDFLQRELPNFLKKRQSEGHGRLRLWSTACSSGEEPYTLAIVVAETLSAFPRVDAKILATDVSSLMLQRATEGLYTKVRLKGMAPDLKARYFHIDRDQYVVNEALRRLVTFRLLNVLGPWPFHGPFDIVFCRNMMIYFDKKSQVDLIQRLQSYLSPGGYLFVGHSESLIGIPHKLKYVEPTIYQKV